MFGVFSIVIFGCEYLESEITKIIIRITLIGLIPVAGRSKTSVFGRSLAGIAGSIPAGGMDVCLLRVVCAVR